jgi:hypothetical protein
MPAFDRSAQPVAVQQKRSIVWPLLAGAVIVALLVLVFKLVLERPPAVVNITTEKSEPEQPTKPTLPPADDQPVAAKVATADNDTNTKAPAAPAKLTATARPKPKKSGSAAYDEAIQAHRTRITKCAQDHGAPPSNARVVIDVTTTGKAKAILLEPADLNASPLGACIKGVLAAAKWPTAESEMRVSVALKAS